MAILSRAFMSRLLAVAASLTSHVVAAPAQPLPGGLVSWWPGEENANDVVGGNNGGMAGGVTFASGKVGKAFSFDGVDDSVNIPGNANLAIAGQISVLAWIKTSDSPNYAGIVSKRGPGPVFAGYEMLVHPTGKVDFFIMRNHSLSIGSTARSSASIEDGQWHHVAGTFDGATVKIYVDGELAGWNPFTGSIGTSNRGVTIGYVNEAPDRFFKGLIDEVRIYNRELCPEEIVASMSPTQAIQNLISVLAGMSMSSPPVNNALGFATAGNYAAACPHMTGFITSINGMSLTTVQKAALIADAEAIRTGLGCK